VQVGQRVQRAPLSRKPHSPGDSKPTENRGDTGQGHPLGQDAQVDTRNVSSLEKSAALTRRHQCTRVVDVKLIGALRGRVPDLSVDGTVELEI